jgi:hypothetical protein
MPSDPRPDQAPNASAAAGPDGGWRRWALALLTSLLLHGGVALWLTLAALAWRTPPLGADPVWLDLDNRLGAPSTALAATPTVPVPARPPRSGATVSAATSAQPHPSPHAPRRPPRRSRSKAPAPASGPTLASPPAEVGPGDAALLVLLRCDHVRDSPFAGAARELLAAFYDYRALLAGSTLDPLRDFDRLLIATPNPYRLTETLLVARHALSAPAARAALEAGVRASEGELRWTETEEAWRGEVSSPPRLPGDPRVLALQGPLIILAAPALLAQLQRPTAPIAPPASAQPPAPPPPPRPWVEILLEGGTATTAPTSADDEPAALLVRAINLPRLIRLPAGLPTPTAGQLEVRATDPARARLVLSFAGPSAAATALRAAQLELARLQSVLMLRVLGVSALLERLQLRRQGAELQAAVELQQAEVVQLLAWFRSILPQVPRARPLRPPPAP